MRTPGFPLITRCACPIPHLGPSLATSLSRPIHMCRSAADTPASLPLTGLDRLPPPHDPLLPAPCWPLPCVLPLPPAPR